MKILIFLISLFKCAIHPKNGKFQNMYVFMTNISPTNTLDGYKDFSIFRLNTVKINDLVGFVHFLAINQNKSPYNSVLGKIAIENESIHVFDHFLTVCDESVAFEYFQMLYSRENSQLMKSLVNRLLDKLDDPLVWKRSSLALMEAIANNNIEAVKLIFRMFNSNNVAVIQPFFFGFDTGFLDQPDLIQYKSAYELSLADEKDLILFFQNLLAHVIQTKNNVAVFRILIQKNQNILLESFDLDTNVEGTPSFVELATLSSNPMASILLQYYMNPSTIPKIHKKLNNSFGIASNEFNHLADRFLYEPTNTEYFKMYAHLTGNEYLTNQISECESKVNEFYEIGQHPLDALFSKNEVLKFAFLAENPFIRIQEEELVSYHFPDEHLKPLVEKCIKYGNIELIMFFINNKSISV